ncbi:sarcosine oxidase subunit gamma [Actinoplanes bogorensis]|uniref:Sarcosine oxidase subunit gamma n=1 Tax=Paractinoplanes bogorensis TaxID=1610840 RepID=A0ABS5YYW3_9ACTN|nr:sarcosine oxidase subunit gamma family protein [Actinoplanes bogorensis]MBU2667879.1 sarcosine oxidase subunit gamma [Actinoplanes bogorensis]
MAEPTLSRTHPLEAWTAAFEALPPAVRITAEPYVPMFDVRGVTAEPNTWIEVDGGRAVWLGPDESLYLGATPPPDAAVTDVSAQRIALRLTGGHVRDVLAQGCAIDLHPRVFGRGRSAVTTLGQAGIVLLALGDDDFLVLVRSSFAGYLADWLLDATLEFT